MTWYLTSGSSQSLIPNATIGLSESMMASKVINPAYYLPVPFWPYYLTAKLSGINNKHNQHEDKYIGIDFTYTFDNNTKLYGELLVDEYPQHSWANNPDKRAHILGLSYPYSKSINLRAEYSNVFNNVYQHRYPENQYKHDDKMIGHWLGQDGDVFDIQLKKVIDQKQSLSIGFQHIRKGIGGFNKEKVDYEGLLNKIEEKENVLKLKYNRLIGNNLKSIFAVDLGQTRNYINKSRKEFVDLFFKVEFNM